MSDHKSAFYDDQEAKAKAKLHELHKGLPLYMRSYLRSIELSKQIRTAIAYTRDLIVFMKYIQEVNPLYRDTPVEQIPFECMESLTFEDINDYQTYLSYNDGKNPHQNGERALARMMCTLHGYFNYEVDHGNLPKSPMSGAARGKRPKEKPIERLDAEQAVELMHGVEAGNSGTERSRLFALQTNLRDTAIVTLLLNTGIRISECVGLDVADIDFDNQSIRVERKGGKIELVYFNDDVAAALYDYVHLERPGFLSTSEEPALFLSNRRQRMAVRSIQEMLKKYGTSILQKPNLHPHTLRKTYGSSLYEETSDISLVAETLGHRSIETTRKHYADVSDEHKKKTKNIQLYK